MKNTGTSVLNSNIHFNIFSGQINLIARTAFDSAYIDVWAIERPLEKVLSMKGSSYYWKDNRNGGKKDIGFIAQDLEKILPEVVATGLDKEKLKSVHYGHIVPVVVEAIKDFYSKFKNHEAHSSQEIAAIKEENAAMKSYLCNKDPAAPFCR